TGLWSLDGVFPFSKTFDSIGPLTSTAADAALVLSTLLDRPAPTPLSLRNIRLGRAIALFEDADPEVARCIDAALKDLEQQGARIVDISFPELEEANAIFTTISRPELIAHLGRERFLAIRDRMNPDVADRAAPGLSVSADEYVRALWRLAELRAFAADAIRDFDAWIAPAKSRLPPPFPGGFESLEAERGLTGLCAGPTRQATVLGLCAATLPVHQYGAPLPVGMQVIGAARDELRLLSLCLAIENVIGPLPRPDLAAFVTPPGPEQARRRPQREGASCP
ncbi:MAG: amidase family protein, partial [Kiloniellales bacterium]